MTGRTMASRAAAAILAAALGACKPTAAPAVLTGGDEAAISRLKAALATAMGRSQIELGPGDPTQSSTISVLPLPPGPLEDRSLARPTIFHLAIEGDDCFVVREDTRERFPLAGVACKPAPP